MNVQWPATKGEGQDGAFLLLQNFAYFAIFLLLISVQVVRCARRVRTLRSCEGGQRDTERRAGITLTHEGRGTRGRINSTLMRQLSSDLPLTSHQLTSLMETAKYGIVLRIKRVFIFCHFLY